MKKIIELIRNHFDLRAGALSHMLNFKTSYLLAYGGLWSLWS